MNLAERGTGGHGSSVRCSFFRMCPALCHVPLSIVFVVVEAGLGWYLGGGSGSREGTVRSAAVGDRRLCGRLVWLEVEGACNDVYFRFGVQDADNVVVYWTHVSGELRAGSSFFFGLWMEMWPHSPNSNSRYGYVVA